MRTSCVAIDFLQGGTSGVNCDPVAYGAAGSFALWVVNRNPANDLSGPYILDSWAGNRYILYRRGSDNSFGFYLNGTAITDAAGVLVDLVPALTWTHVALTWDGIASKQTVYRNGVPFATFSVAGVGSSTATPTLGRRFSNSSNWNGLMAEVGIWNAVLSPSDVLKLAQGWTPEEIRAESLLLYYDGREKWRGNTFSRVNTGLALAPPWASNGSRLAAFGARL